MHTYVKLKDGRIMIVWSDNIKEETMNVYPVDLENDFDPEIDQLIEIDHSDIICTDTNYDVVKRS